MSMYYIVPSWKCNLRCSHCFLKSTKDNTFNFFEFFKTNLIPKKSIDDKYVLFGGEPFLQEQLTLKLLDTGLIDSISTNLLLLNKPLFEKIVESGVRIATSWNMNRFYQIQEFAWLEHLKKLTDAKVHVRLLITLDPATVYNPESILNILNRVDEFANVNEFLFEPWVPCQQDYNVDVNRLNNLADRVLYKIYREYHGKMRNLMVDKIKFWNCDCSEVYTVHPEGKITKGCPMYSEPAEPLTECLTCKHSSHCKPCMLQKTCTYPKKFAKIILGND